MNIYFTNIDQGRRLLKLGLGPESADMFYCSTKEWSYDTEPTLNGVDRTFDVGDIPCWSVGRLIDYKGIECNLELDKNWVSYEGCDSYDSSYRIQPVIFKDGPLIELLYKVVEWLLLNGYNL